MTESNNQFIFILGPNSERDFDRCFTTHESDSCKTRFPIRTGDLYDHLVKCHPPTAKLMIDNDGYFLPEVDDAVVYALTMFLKKEFSVAYATDDRFKWLNKNDTESLQKQNLAHNLEYVLRERICYPKFLRKMVQKLSKKARIYTVDAANLFGRLRTGSAFGLFRKFSTAEANNLLTPIIEDICTVSREENTTQNNTKIPLSKLICLSKTQIVSQFAG